MSLPPIFISIGSSLVSLLASKSVETAAEPFLSNLKNKIEKFFTLGKYEALQRALEGAREDILLKFATSAERAFVGQMLNSIFDIKPSPFVDEFAKQINQNYLLPSSPTHLPQYLAESFHQMVGKSSTTSPITDSEDISIANVLSNFFLAFRERLLKEEDFAHLREYYLLREAEKQTFVQEQILDGIERIAANTAKPAEDFDAIRKEYLSHLVRELSAHTIRGFAPQVGGRRVISLPLAKIFIPLRAVEGRPTLAEYAEEDLFRQAANEVNRELENDHHWQHHFRSLEKRFALLEIRQEAEKPLTLAELLKSSRAILLGDPGTGKTTITRYVTYSLAINDLTHVGSDMAGRVPVLVRIANFAKAFEQDSTLHIIEYVAKELTSRPEFGNYLRWAIEQNLCLVILDGLDEVSDSGLRIRVTDRIQNMVASFSGNHYLVTSRIVGYDQSPLTQEFQHATLQDLTDEDKNRFIRLWYDAIQEEIGSGAHVKGANDLITALRNKPQISRMAANPLLLTIMVLMHWRGTKLPSRRVQVYQNATDTLIEYWTAQREGVDLDAELIKNILAPIAHYILSSNVSGVIALQDLLPRFHEGIVREHGCSQEEARRIGREMLRDLNEQSGLFLERGLDANDKPVYGFLHQTFGEYLAALYLAQEVQKSSFILKDYIHQSIWHEPFLLLLGHLSLYSKPQADMLMRQMLAYPAPYEETLQRNLLFAADCLGDGIQIDPILRDEILERLAKLIQHPVSQIRDAAIERYQNIAATQHRDAAVLALRKCCEFDNNEKLEQMSRNMRFDLAKALIYLKEQQAAQPIVWQLDDDNYGNSVRRLRFEYWPELAADYLLQLQADNEYDFTVSSGKNLSNSTLGPVDAELAKRVLGEEKLIALTKQLSDRMKDDNDKAVLHWIAILTATKPSYEAMLELTQLEVPAKIRRLVATRLFKSGYRENAVAVLQSLRSDTPEETNEAIQALLEAGEKSHIEIQLLRDIAVYGHYGNSYLAIMNLLKLGDKEFVLPLVLYFLAGSNRHWELVESLIEHDLKEIALAATEWMALYPGYVNRWKACEALLKAGELKKAIPLIQYVAYECQNNDGYQAIQKLIMLSESERVKPLLYAMANSSLASERYQASLALAKADFPPPPIELNIPARTDLKVKILKERTQAYKNAIQNLCQVGIRTLADINSSDLSVNAVKKLAYFTLARFVESKNVSETNLPVVELAELLDNDSSIVRLRACFHTAEKGLFEQIIRVCNEILSDTGKNVSLIAQEIAMSWQVQLYLRNEQPEEIYKILMTPNPLVRQRAARALGLIGNHKAVPFLLSAMNDNDIKTRQSIIFALGVLGNPDAALPLMQLLTNQERDVRFAASVALGMLGSFAVTPHLIEMLTDVENKVRRAASYALRLLGDSTAIPALIAALKDDDKIVRAGVAYSLGQFANLSATQALIDALNDTDKEVRSNAAQALGHLGDRCAVKALINNLIDKNSKVRRYAVLALGELGDLSVVQSLNSMLLDKKIDVRTAAVRALKQLGAPINFQAIAASLKDTNPERRAAAVDILASENVDFAFDSLVVLLSDVDNTVRTWANWGLGQLGKLEAIPFLQNSLKDDSAIVRRDAARSLGRLGNSSVVPSLFIMLGDPDSGVREGTAWALGQIKDGLAVHPLIALLNDNDKNVRKSTATSLGQLNDKIAIQPLIFALNDPAIEVRRATAISLGKFDDSVIIPHLYRGMGSVKFRALARMKILDAVPRILFISSEGDETSSKDTSFSLIHLDPVVALNVLKQYERRFPKKSWVHNSRGQAFLKLGNLVATKESFHKALELEPESTTNLLALVNFYLEQEDLQEAMKYASKTVLYSPNSSTCLLTYAVTLWVQGEVELARLHLKKAKLQNRHVTDTDDLQFEHFWREKALKGLDELLTLAN